MLGMEILVIIGLILLLLVLWIISVQRKFAVMDGNIQNAMNQIGVQISSRFDALFAVLDLMKGYAADDTQPLMERAAARRSVITARSAPEEVSEQEQVIEETVKSIRLAAERNPLYEEIADFTIRTDEQSARAVANQIVEQLGF